MQPALEGSALDHRHELRSAERRTEVRGGKERVETTRDTKLLRNCAHVARSRTAVPRGPLARRAASPLLGAVAARASAGGSSEERGVALHRADKLGVLHLAVGLVRVEHLNERLGVDDLRETKLELGFGQTYIRYQITSTISDFSNTSKDRNTINLIDDFA